MLEFIVANLSGTVRQTTLHGREFLVAPMTLIVPGVLNGSRGPLLYPRDEVGKLPQAWNNIPIVLDHPHNGASPMSAKSPEVLNKQGLGAVYNAQIENGNLVAEGWFDVANLKRNAPQLESQIRNGQKIELSTGLGGDEEEVSGIHNNREYHAIYRNYRPDHLAVFIDKRGACSIADGCGVNNEDQDCGKPECPT